MVGSVCIVVWGAWVVCVMWSCILRGYRLVLGIFVCVVFVVIVQAFHTRSIVGTM